MYKKYNFKPKNQFPQRNQQLHSVVEKILPFLLIITSFLWLFY